MDRAMAHHQHLRTSEKDEFEQKVSTKWPMYQLKDVDFPRYLESQPGILCWTLWLPRGRWHHSGLGGGADDISLASLGQMTSVCSCHTGQHQPSVAGPRRRSKRFSCRGEAWENWPTLLRQGKVVNLIVSRVRTGPCGGWAWGSSRPSAITLEASSRWSPL